MDTMPERGENGYGRITMAILATKLDNLIALMGECKVAISSQDNELHNIKERVKVIETQLQDFLDFKKAIIGQMAGLVLGAVGLTGIVTYLVTNLTK